MQALKALVIGLGILILIGMAVITVTIYQRATAPEPPPALETAAPAGETGSIPPPAFGTVDVTVPAGAHIQEMVAEGDRLVLHLRLRDGTPAIMVLDLETGEHLGTVNLRRGQ